MPGRLQTTTGRVCCPDSNQPRHCCSTAPLLLLIGPSRLAMQIKSQGAISMLTLIIWPKVVEVLFSLNYFFYLMYCTLQTGKVCIHGTFLKGSRLGFFSFKVENLHKFGIILHGSLFMQINSQLYICEWAYVYIHIHMFQTIIYIAIIS